MELALRWRAPLGQPRRVSSRSMGASTPMLTPQPPRRRRSQQGWDSRTSQQPHGPLLRSASQSRREAPARSGPSVAMARMDVRSRWVPFCACREAQGRECVRVPQDTRTSCTDSPQLFERSAQRAASSAAHPLPEHRRLPAAQRRDTHSRVAFSLVTFFWRSKRKSLACRATPGSRTSHGHAVATAKTSFGRLNPNGWGKNNYKNNSCQRFMYQRQQPKMPQN